MSGAADPLKEQRQESWKNYFGNLSSAMNKNVKHEDAYAHRNPDRTIPGNEAQEGAPHAIAAQPWLTSYVNGTPVKEIMNEITDCVIEATKYNLCTFIQPSNTTNSTASNSTADNSTLFANDKNVPCYVIKEPPLIRVYVIAGFFIPVVVVLYVAFKWSETMWKRWKKKRNFKDFTFTELDTDADLDEGDDSFEVPMMESIKNLDKRRRNHSKILLWMADCATIRKKWGKASMAIALFCAALSFVLYLTAVSKVLPSLELCNTMPNIREIMDFFLNIILLLYLIIRLVGRTRKVGTALSIYSVVDYFTIPVAITSLFLDRYFTGFQFLRSVNLLWTVQLVVSAQLFDNESKEKLTYLCILVAVITFCGTGFLHFFENAGDPRAFTDGDWNGQRVTYWRCFLFLYGKVTLIDLSGIQAITTMGKLATILFQLCALATIARCIPEIMKLIALKPEYDRPYMPPNSNLHVILSGDLTVSALDSFLAEFFHKDRKVSEYFTVVILNNKKPDGHIRRLKQLYYNKIDYRRGTVMKGRDLLRVKLKEAMAVILLVDVASLDTEKSDANQIMRVVSIKDIKSSARVIVQLIGFQSKVNLNKVRPWAPLKGDMAICAAEIRLGLLAQSCDVMGFSSLVAIFFNTRRPDADYKDKHNDPWFHDYVQGAAMEIYCRPLSDAFDGMTFRQVCEFCYLRFNITLIAVITDKKDRSKLPIINPDDNFLKIKAGQTLGFFISQTVEEVFPAWNYCPKCHKDIYDPKEIKQCKCSKRKEKAEEEAKEEKKEKTPEETEARKEKRRQSDMYHEETAAVLDDDKANKIWEYIKTHKPRAPIGKEKGEEEENYDEEANLGKQYDLNGLFHWRPKRSFKSVLITRDQAANKKWNEHVVLLVNCATPNAQRMDLGLFALTLRSSLIEPESLSEIVIMGPPKFLEKEWEGLCNIPKITIVDGDPMNRADLRALRLTRCKRVVVMTAHTPEESKGNSETESLEDRSAILTTLNIRDLVFSPAEREEADDGTPQRSNRVGYHRVGFDVPMITDLLRENNVRFLDLYDDNRPYDDFYLSNPFVCGKAFSERLIDLLAISSLFNPGVVHLLNKLVFGGASWEGEILFAEGAGIVGDTTRTVKPNDDCQIVVTQFAIDQGRYSEHADSTYGGLFIDALNAENRLCLGVFRKMNLYDSNEPMFKRFVITSPPSDFTLHSTDLIFAVDQPRIADLSAGLRA